MAGKKAKAVKASAKAPASSLGSVENAVLGAVSVFRSQRLKAWVSAYFRPAETCGAGPLSGAAVTLMFAGLINAVVNGLVNLIVLVAFFGLLGGGIGGLAAGANGGMMGGAVGGAIGLVAAVVAFIIGVILTPIIVIIAGFIVSAIYFVIARVLGGKGSFTLQTHGFALVFAGTMLLALPFNVLGLLPWVGGIFAIAAMLVNLYSIYSYYRLFRAVHQLSSMRAAVVTLLPVLVLAALLVLVFGSLVGFAGSRAMMGY